MLFSQRLTIRDCRDESHSGTSMPKSHCVTSRMRRTVAHLLNPKFGGCGGGSPGPGCVSTRSLAISICTLEHAFWAILLLASTVCAQSTTQTPPASPMTARQSQWHQASLDERIRLAEHLGEEGAEAFADKKGYQPLLRNGDKSLPQGFDQVYRAKDGSIVVIEAKGGTSAIDRAYGCEQGTPEWAVHAAKKRVAQSSKASVAEQQAARLVLEVAQQGIRPSKLSGPGTSAVSRLSRSSKVR